MNPRSAFLGNVRQWMPWILGAVAALYSSRILVEFAPANWPTPLLWFAGLILALASFTVTRIAHAFGCTITPIAVLALYLLSPTIDPRLAGATAFVALTSVLLQFRTSDFRAGADSFQAVRRISHGTDASVFAISLIVYIITLSPGLLPADSGEFQLVAPTLGIAHPPGYALYTLVGKAFTLIPLGTPAYRLNLLSAVLAAATLTLVHQTARQLTGSAVVGFIAITALAGATTFWAQATTANIRMPTAFFTALLLWLLVRFSATRSHRALVLAAFVVGLGLTHHGSLVFLAVPAALYVVLLEPQILLNGRLLGQCVLAFVLSLFVLSYFPLRGAADVPLNPGGLTTLDGFVNHVLALGFRGDVLAFANQQALLDRSRVLLNILEMQFGRPLLVLALPGILLPFLRSIRVPSRSSVRRPGSAQVHNPRSEIPNLQSRRANIQYPFSTHHWLLLTGTFGLTAAAAMTYRAPQTVEYLMPAYVPLTLLMGVGAASLVRRLPPSSVRAMFLSTMLLLGLTNIWQTAPSFRELSRRSDARQFAEPILQNAPANAVLLSNWHWATAFWYLQTVEGLRPDVDVQYIAPAGAEPYPETWRRRLADSLDDRPVLVTSRYPTYADLPVRLIPFHSAFAVADAEADMPPYATRLEANFDDAIMLQGYTLSTQQPKPGEALTIHLWWRMLANAQRDYSVFVHLIDSTGRPIGQSDVRYPARRLTQGTRIEDSYSLSILPTVPPGTYQIVAGFYFTPDRGGFQRLTSNGTDAVQLGLVSLAPRQAPPVTQHPQAIPFADGPTLVGVDYDTSRPDATRVYLHWRVSNGAPTVVTLYRSQQPIASAAVPIAPADTYVTTALDVPPDTRNLTLTLEMQNGDRKRGLGAWRQPILGPSIQLPGIDTGDRYLAFGQEAALIGADWAESDDEVIVNLEWLGLKPLVRDYTVSVQLLGDAGWKAQHDGTPALGAIPTLKWIRGTHVVDPHRLALPDDVIGAANIQVSVYDAFTQTPLGVLDDRFQRAGQGKAAVIGRLDIPTPARR